MEVKTLLIEVVKKQVMKILRSDGFKSYVNEIVNEILTESLSQQSMPVREAKKTPKPTAKRTRPPRKKEPKKLIDELREMVKDDSSIDDFDTSSLHEAKVTEVAEDSGLNKAIFDPTRNKKLLKLMDEKSNKFRQPTPKK